jgi:hypothetical protein
MLRIFLSGLLILSPLATGCGSLAADTPPSKSGQRPGSYRFERDGWIYVHFEGTPEAIGYQHGSLLAAEIADLLRVIKPYLERSSF